jgi:hypothetical protein
MTEAGLGIAAGSPPAANDKAAIKVGAAPKRPLDCPLKEKGEQGARRVQDQTTIGHTAQAAAAILNCSVFGVWRGRRRGVLRATRTRLPGDYRAVWHFHPEDIEKHRVANEGRLRGRTTPIFEVP